MATAGLSRRDFGRLTTAGLLTAAGVGAAPATRAAAETRQWRVSGVSAASLQPFDDTMRSFMQARNISAGSLAVTRGGRLVLARGYTWSADPALSTQPTSLFRIASISKPVTATAVLRLAQEGRLDLAQPVTSLLNLTPPPGGSADPRLREVTVLRLLQHLGGWDSSLSGDPMFRDATIARALGVQLPITREHVMRYVTGRPLDHDPGTRYAYSNYGYLLLGRVIEAVTGLSYPEYVRRYVLSPLGISRMRLGRTAPSLRAPGEMPYVSQYRGTTVLDSSGVTVPYPDGAFNLENMDAHGGWLASAVDLVRFASLYDPASAGTVLSAEWAERAFDQPETGINANGWYYGAGWLVRPVSGGGRNTWHNGSLAGTYTLLVRTYHGMSWAVLFNQRDDASGLSYADIDPRLWNAVGAVTSWPTHDLYSRYF